ncbi:MAG: hypothetical protein QMD96_09010 [Anaerosomatales bacterium]|nr:hypothetical protein [Anaerosomatales bacterium]
MDCAQFDKAFGRYVKTGERPEGFLAHANQCKRCGAKFAEGAARRLQAKADAAFDAAIAAAVERARQRFVRDPRDQVAVLADAVRDWAESLRRAGVERVASAIRLLDLGFSPRFAVAMGDDGTLQAVRPLEHTIDLSPFGSTGWEPEAVLRIAPERIELLLKPDPAVPDSERLLPRVALERQDGYASVPDVTQSDRATPRGWHVFVVWEAEPGERSDEVFVSPMRAQLWFSKPASDEATHDEPDASRPAAETP